MAAAIHRGCVIAIDDRVAIKHLASAYPQTRVVTTETLIVALIKAGSLTISDAVRMKTEWEAKYRFRLKIGSFKDLL
jgi:hypothetical protein